MVSTESESQPFFRSDRQEQLDRLMEKLSEHDKKIEAIKSQTKSDTIVNDASA